jgi:D-alanine-D-alanine ligase
MVARGVQPDAVRTFANGCDLRGAGNDHASSSLVARFFAGRQHARMTLRIGFAYNVRPSAAEGANDAPAEEEPPSRRSVTHRGQDWYAEWDDPATIAAVANALAQAGPVIFLEADTAFPRKLHEARPDIVFNIAEGLNGASREAHVPAICEFFGVPYTASDPLTLALALDKRRAKEVFLARGIRTPRWMVWGDGNAAHLNGAAGGGPFVVKPLYEGSSKGIPASAFCDTIAAAERRASQVVAEYGQPALIEEFLPGREFTIGVLGNDAAARALPAVEIRFDALPEGAPPLYGYEAKWLWDTPEQPLEIFMCPAMVDDTLDRDLSETALAAYRALGCRDWARIDLRLDAAGAPHVLEINPLPGILPNPSQNSCLPKAARAAGIPYDALILRVLDCALERYGMSR